MALAMSLRGGALATTKQSLLIESSKEIASPLSSVSKTQRLLGENWLAMTRETSGTRSAKTSDEEESHEAQFKRKFERAVHVGKLLESEEANEEEARTKARKEPENEGEEPLHQRSYSARGYRGVKNPPTGTRSGGYIGVKNP